MEFNLKTSEEGYDLEASVRLIGRDLLVAIWGGERPHIGAVAVAQPRPSLRNATELSASASVICLPGHKEDDLAKTAALRLAAALNTPVVVTAGIHWDALDEEGIRIVVGRAKMLVGMILERIEDTEGEFRD